MSPAFAIVATAPNGATLQHSQATGEWAVCPHGSGPEHADSGVTQTRTLAELWFVRDEGGELQPS